MPLEADASSFVNFAGFMVKKCFPDYCSIQKDQRTGVTVEFLQGGDAFLRDRDPEALIVFPDPFMGTVVVVFLQIDLPVMVQVLQRSDLLGLCLGGKIIHYLMEFLDFSLGFPTLHRCMDNPDGKPGKGEFQLLCSILGSIVEIAPAKTSELRYTVRRKRLYGLIKL